jgi:hypothetical protein
MNLRGIAMTTRTIEVTKDINVSAPTAWEVIRTGRDVNLWFSAIDTCQRDGDVRFCTMAGGGDLEENILSINDDTMTFTYEIVKHPMPVGIISSVMAVKALSPTSCKIRWSTEIDGDGPAVEDTVQKLEGLYLQGIIDLEAYSTQTS